MGNEVKTRIQPEKIVLGFGSNIGDGPGNLRAALRSLEREGIEMLSLSSIYYTSPVGPQDQRRFTNAAALAETTLSPRELLVICKSIEHEMGRNMDEKRWGPRVIDIDILLYGARDVDEPDLRIQHRERGNRLFVLAPALEAAPDFIMPDGRTLGEFARPRIDALRGSGQDIERIDGDIFS